MFATMGHTLRVNVAHDPGASRTFHDCVVKLTFLSDDASSPVRSLRSVNVISPISIMFSSISGHCCPSYNGSAQSAVWSVRCRIETELSRASVTVLDGGCSHSPVRTWSMVAGFVRRMHLYHSKNRLSTSTSNTSSSAKDGLGVSSSVSYTMFEASVPWNAPRPQRVGRLGLAMKLESSDPHRKNSPLSLHDQSILEKPDPSELRSRTLMADETKSRFCARTRSRIFGWTNFIHFFVGSSYAVKSAGKHR